MKIRTFFSSVGSNGIYRWHAGACIYDKVFRVNCQGELWSLPKDKKLEKPNQLPCSDDFLLAPKGITHRALFSVVGGDSVFSGSEDCCIRSWNIEAPRESRVLCGWEDPMTVAAYDFKYHKRIQGESSRNLCLVEEFSNVRLNAADKKVTATRGHKDCILDMIAVRAPHSTYLLSCSRDGAVKVWK